MIILTNPPGKTDELNQELEQRRIPVMAHANTVSDVYVDLVNINDKGVLTGISQSVHSTLVLDRPGLIKLIIDGSTIYDGAFSSDLSGDANEANYASLAFTHRFDVSLQIQHMRSTSGTVHSSVSYTTD